MYSCRLNMNSLCFEIQDGFIVVFVPYQYTFGRACYVNQILLWSQDTGYSEIT